MEQTPRLLDCWYLTGPTAAGKTAVGLELADIISAEIISLDSMAIYRRMDIGTAKPDATAQRRCPHHLIDLVDPTDEYSLHDYVAAAWEMAEVIRARGKRVLFVGGTPLYLKALLRGILIGPGPDWDFRDSVADEASRLGPEQLHERLQQVDPLCAAKLHPHDLRRVIRALEVYKLTGTPLGHLQLQFDQPTPRDSCRVFQLEWSREAIRDRIERRIEMMMAAGFEDEVATLRSEFSELSRTARQAVGYHEMFDYFDGATTRDEAIDLIKIRTKQFAKRQRTWFRGLGECRPVPCADRLSPSAAARQIAESIDRSDWDGTPRQG